MGNKVENIISPFFGVPEHLLLKRHLEDKKIREEFEAAQMIQLQTTLNTGSCIRPSPAWATQQITTHISRRY